RMTRTAISPRLAIRSRSNSGGRSGDIARHLLHPSNLAYTEWPHCANRSVGAEDNSHRPIWRPWAKAHVYHRSMTASCGRDSPVGNHKLDHASDREAIDDGRRGL